MEKSFCPLPWNHLSIEPDGSVYSCCHTAEEKALGSLKEQTLKEIFNGENNQSIRKQFLNGETPLQCQICVDAEKWGQISLRQSAQRKFQVKKNLPKLTYLSLRPGNTCNLSCRICNPFLSTAWISDAKKLDRPYPQKAISVFHSKDHFLQFRKDFPKLDTLYFAGGEPFLTVEFYQLLEDLIEKKQTDTQLIINTNFTVDGLGKWDAFTLLSKFKNVSLDLSIDGMGELNDYMRKGSHWGEIDARIKKVRLQYPDIRLHLNPTISILNIFQFSIFITAMLERDFAPVDIRINPLLKPDHLNIKNLNKYQKAELTKELKTLKKKILLDFSLEESIGLFCQIDGLIKMMLENQDKTALTQFFEESEMLDEIRNEKTQKLIPRVFE